MRAARDQVGERCDHLHFAQLRDADEAVRVEIVAEQQRLVVVTGGTSAACRSARGSPRRSSPTRARSARRRARKTGSSSRLRGGRVRRATALSASASAAIVSHKVRSRLDRRVDGFVVVRERDEHRLELRRRDVDPAREQVLEERRVLGMEERQHRADARHAAVLGESVREPGRLGLELVVEGNVARAPQHRQPAAVASGFPESVPAW